MHERGCQLFCAPGEKRGAAPHSTYCLYATFSSDIQDRANLRNFSQDTAFGFDSCGNLCCDTEFPKPVCVAGKPQKKWLPALPVTFRKRVRAALHGFQNPSLHIKVVLGEAEEHLSAASTTSFSRSCSAPCTQPRQKTVKLLSPPQAHKNFTGSEKIANHACASEIEPDFLSCL